MKRKVFNYYTLAQILKSLYESCMKAWEQQKNGEKVTACGMSDEDIEELCEDYLPNLMNPMMSKEEVAHPTNPVEGCADANPKTELPNDT